MVEYLGPSPWLKNAKSLYLGEEKAIHGLIFSPNQDDSPAASTAKIDAIFCHANGFCAGVYASFLGRLSVLTGLTILAIDFPGSGASPNGPNPKKMVDWKDLINPVVAGIAPLNEGRPLMLLGHSMGGTIATFIAGILGQKISRVLAFDPVFMPLAARAFMYLPFGVDMVENHFAYAKRARNRTQTFPSRAAAFAAWSGRGSLKRWDRDALADYCQAGLTEENGQYRLACAPALESRIYAAQRQNGYKALRLASAHFDLLCPQYGSITVKSASAAIKKKGGTFHFLPKCGHLMLQEQPERMAAITAEILAQTPK